MKNNQKKWLFAVMFLWATIIFAQTFTVNGLTYNITSSSVPYEVEIGDNTGTFVGGAINIPETVENGGITYTVTAIADRAFQEMKSGTTAPTSISIPGTVKRIGVRAFIRNNLVTSLSIAEGVEEIGELAFFNFINLTGTIEIPSTVIKIENRAFENNNFDIMILGNPTPVTIHPSVFTNYKPGDPATLANATLKVPNGSKSAYESKDVWKDFGTIIEESPTLSLADIQINEIEIQFHSKYEGKYTIHNTLGQLILSGIAKQNIDISSLKPDVYILSTNNGGIKFIK